MLRKIIALFLALAVLLCAFAGCASKPEAVSSGEASAMVKPAEVPAEEPADMLSGSWTPQGAVYRNTVIDLSDNESLSSMYSGTALTFSEGNTFSYYNIFIYTGTYELYSENIYHLQTKGHLAERGRKRRIRKADDKGRQARICRHCAGRKHHSV